MNSFTIIENKQVIGTATEAEPTNQMKFYFNNCHSFMPHFNEQTRIVGKVEELFSFLDAGVESLRKFKCS